MYTIPTCKKCGSREFAPTMLRRLLKCAKCGTPTENNSIIISVYPHEPEQMPTPVADDDWMWLIVGVALAAAIVALVL